MSLINNMLNELKKNKPSPLKQLIVGAGMISLAKQQGTAKWKFIYGLIILAIVGGTIGYYLHIHKNRALGSVKPLQSAKATTTIVAPTAKLQDIVLEHQNDRTILDFILSSPTPYYLEHSSVQQLAITLHDTGILGNLPVSLENTFITSLNTEQHQEDVIITLNLLPETKIEELKLIKEPQPRLHLVFSNPQAVNRTTNMVAKVPAPLNLEEQALERYQEIQQLLTQNDQASAIQKLHMFIGDFPDHVQARTTLISLLIQAGRLQKADDVLMVGLSKNGDYAPFIKLKTHILLKEHKIAEAIEWSEKHVPAVEDVEYLALLASLYQQRGDFILAAQVYNQLTKIEPQKSAWWLGLGISLERAEKYNAAREAYKQADNASDVSPELRAFLEEKMKK